MELVFAAPPLVAVLGAMAVDALGAIMVVVVVVVLIEVLLLETA
ncbi:MAG: hypothetical protein ACYCS1_01160 [Gammaproteobacteria bacterium]